MMRQFDFNTFLRSHQELFRHASLVMMQQAGAVAVHKDMSTLLNYVQENSVVGTASTGNMPLKHIRAVTARFTEPPELDHMIGDKLYKLRSEDDVWSLYFLHAIADTGGLMKTLSGKRWQVTKSGRKFLSLNPLEQIISLLHIWYYRVNWLIAYPMAGLGDELPREVVYFAWTPFTGLRVDEPLDYKTYANELIDATGLRWGSQDRSSAEMLLHAAIEHMIVNVFQAFGFLRVDYREKTLGPSILKTPQTLYLTELGVGLLPCLLWE